jgi:hypothetical protein
MNQSALAALHLPLALRELLTSTYGDTESACRAALAPWPDLAFRSAAQEQALFAPGARADAPRRVKLEHLLRTETSHFAMDKPFFVVEGTTGRLRSPYPELTDAEYWLFVDLWEDEKAARQELAARYSVLDDQSSLAYLQRFRRPGIGAWLDRLLHGPLRGEDPLSTVYVAHSRNRHGVYA